jgi:cell division protein FtsB
MMVVGFTWVIVMTGVCLFTELTVFRLLQKSNAKVWMLTQERENLERHIEQLTAENEILAAMSDSVNVLKSEQDKIDLATDVKLAALQTSQWLSS